MPFLGSSSNDNKLQNNTGTGVGQTYPATGTGTMGEPGMGGGMSGGMADPSMGNSATVCCHRRRVAADTPCRGNTPRGHAQRRNDGRPAIRCWYRHRGRLSGTGTGTKTQNQGNIVGSKSLQAQGLQMEQEARGMKIQSQELAEAERLEQEAARRRERAVAHGAHPDNRHVGGLGGAAATGGPGAYN
ncbi:hypothetical protein K438DRAFT_1775904 [Mycena galopus ATCC 62051]|nr:hypothetical protein K438DRAFT_1775904 [Mycena galopus ATCC 62051]